MGAIAFEVARRTSNGVTLVADEAIREAQRAIWRELRLVAEPGGATALAALASGALRPAPGEHVVLVSAAPTATPPTSCG